MAQIVYLGTESDFTQESGLLASKIGSKARVAEGMGVSISTDTLSNLILIIQPGIFIMPDGMVVKETEAINLPLVNLDPTEAGYTLIAKRYGYDVVYYDLVQGEHFQDTLYAALDDSDPNLVAMPLSFVYKLDSSLAAPTDSPALYYRVRDLGSRGSSTYHYHACPIPNLYQDRSRLEIKTSVETPRMLFHHLLPSLVDSPTLTYYPVYAGANEFLKTVSFRGRKWRNTAEPPPPVNLKLKITSQYLQGMSSYLSSAVQYLEFVDVMDTDGTYLVGPSSLTLKTFVYPAGAKIVKDLLTIEVINSNSTTQERVGVTPFELNEIILSTLGIFG